MSVSAARWNKNNVACCGALYRRSYVVLGVTALFFALLPSCSQAKSNAPKLSPQAELMLNDIADLFFGSKMTVPPVADQTKYLHASPTWDRSCNGGKQFENLDARDNTDLRNALIMQFYKLQMSGIICDDVTKLDYMIRYDRPELYNNSIKIIYNLSSNLGKTPKTNRPVKRYSQGFFSKSGDHCQLWLRRNDVGQINFAVVRILSKPPLGYSVTDHRQQECYVRGTFVAMGLEGAAEVPFEKLAFRSPFPVGLYYSVDRYSKVRKYTLSLTANILFALPKAEFESFTRGPVHRKEFMAALAKLPKIEEMAEGFVRSREREGKELRATSAPVLEFWEPQTSSAPSSCSPSAPMAQI